MLAERNRNKERILDKQIFAVSSTKEIPDWMYSAVDVLGAFRSFDLGIITEALPKFAPYHFGDEYVPGAQIAQQLVEQRLAKWDENNKVYVLNNSIMPTLVDKSENREFYSSIHHWATEWFGQLAIDNFLEADRLAEPNSETSERLSEKGKQFLAEATYHRGRFDFLTNRLVEVEEESL